jgi:sugar phosphate isomerase/epimerase/predicted metal-dependent hydrolase
MEEGPFVTTPQEPTASRILPFRPRRARTAHQRQAESPSNPLPEEIDQTIDRLLNVSPVTDPLPGEGDGVTHLRAVQLGASSGAFYPHILTEHVPFAAQQLGISTIEVMLQTHGEYDPAFHRTVAGNARAAGVNVHSMHLLSRVHPFFDPYSRRVEEAHTLFRKAVDGAVELGAGVIVWHGPDSHQVSTDEGWERFIELAHLLAITCGEAGIALGIENVSYGAISQVRNVVNLALRLEEIGTPEQVGFVFDPFQAAEAGANPFMVLAAMGNRLVNVHISDYRNHDTTVRHLLPGDGDLPWSALVRAVAGSGYRGPIMIEGPLGTGNDGMERVRKIIEPLIRSVFPFSPDGVPSSEEDQATTLASPPAGILKGIALFNQGEFHAQHEEIEAEWHAERGPIRRLYQGILQIGVGFHHALNGNQRGAVALLRDGIEKTSGFLPQALGIDTARLVRESQACLEHIERLGPDDIDQFDPDTIPTIVFAED